MHPAFLYFPGARLSLPELSSARIDGLVVAIGEGYIPADLVEESSTRATSIATLISSGTAASGPTAAWIHGAGDAPPSPHHIRRAVDRRIRPNPPRTVIFHDTVAPPSDLVVIDTVSVTTPLRTMIDLALALHRDESVLRWMSMLAVVSPELVDDAIRALATMTRVPGIRAGRGALERIALRRM